MDSRDRAPGPIITTISPPSARGRAILRAVSPAPPAFGSGTSLRAASHLGAFVAGAALGAAALAHALPTPLPREVEPHVEAAELFSEALRHVDRYYVEPVIPHDLAQDAVRAVVDALDGDSAFLPPGEYRRLQEDTGGRHSGVGVSLAPSKAGPSVERVVAGSPAARAGVSPGDQIREVNGVAAADLGDRAPRVFEEMLRGRPGSRVEVRVARADKDRLLALVREPIATPSVEWTVVDAGASAGVGIVTIERFQDGTGREVARALGGIARQTGYPLRGVVLDLRGNPGGLLEAAIEVADLFLDEGLIARVRGRRGAVVSQWRARAAGTFRDVPLLVLLDRGSASAAEILAGALQDHERAVLAGGPSYGKGSVQTLFDLPGGSGLRLTTSHYYTPLDRAIGADGLVPNISLDDELLDASPVRSVEALASRWRHDAALTWAVDIVGSDGAGFTARGPRADP
jgi:carboxyl-terminal processing protease